MRTYTGNYKITKARNFYSPGYTFRASLEYNVSFFVKGWNEVGTGRTLEEAKESMETWIDDLIGKIVPVETGTIQRLKGLKVGE